MKTKDKIDNLLNLKELLWILFQGFSENIIPSNDLDEKKLIFFSEKFGLSSRIGGIYSKVKDLKDNILIKNFLEKHRENQKKNLIIISCCSKLLELSKNLGIPTIFLKGAHLLLTKRTKLGYRSVADIDILVPEESAFKFFKFLLEKGFKSSKNPREDLHLPVLFDKFCGVEIHKKIPFLRLKGEKDFINFDQIEKNFGLDFVENNGEKFFVLSEKCFIAHLFVHSLFHHYYSPHLYPFTRFFTDISDLDLGKEKFKENIDFIFDNFEIPFKKEKAISAIELLNFFKNGKKEEIDNLSFNAKELFIHLIRGILDSSYCYSLRFKAIKNRYFFYTGFDKWKKIIRDVIWISSYQIDNLYTKPKNNFHLFFLRLYHIINVLFKILKFLFIKIFK